MWAGPGRGLGQGVRGIVTTRGFVGLAIRWAAKIRGFVDPGVKANLQLGQAGTSRGADKFLFRLPQNGT